jgi:hypothetical protein
MRRSRRPRAATPHLDGLMADVTEVPERLVLDGEFLDGLRRVRRSSRCVYYVGTLVKAVQTLIVANRSN